MFYEEKSVNDILDNPFSLIGEDWMLITAGDEKKHNTMTASWGQVGIMWNRPIACVYLRPQRYTRDFVEQQSRYSLSFFAKGQHRPALNLLGTKSGREGNKIAETDLHVTLLDGVPAFEEARLVFVCRKLYQQEFTQAGFVDTSVVDAFYPQKDFHFMYVGEIEKVYTNKNV